MTQYLLWQPWITIKNATASAVINQPITNYLDFGGVSEALIRLETKGTTTSASTVSIETSSTISGPWEIVHYVTTSSTEAVLNLSTDPNADYKLWRYIRWSVTGSGAGAWSATFQISVKCKELQHTLYRERSVESGEIQPWTTIAGGIATADPIVPLESSWIDTQGMDKLSLRVEVAESTNSTLFIQKAMSLEGPWTNAVTITTAGSNLYTFETKQSATTYDMERFFSLEYDRYYYRLEDVLPHQREELAIG